MRIPVEGLGKVGVIKDVYSADIPPEAWTSAQNCRMGPYGAEKFLGHTMTLGTDTSPLNVPSYWLFYAPVPGGPGYWLNCGANKVYARSSQSPYTATNITRQSAGVDVNYGATQDRKWNGGPFGGAFILNNGIDQPQAWTAIAPATKLVNLSTIGSSPWDSTHTCAVMRPFGRYLVAVDVTKGTTRYPQMVKWSHPASPGAFPVSWNPADPAVDAGEYSLQDAAGPIVEQLGLRDKQMLYTLDQVWQMSWVGGVDIFGFQPVLREQGALGQNCVARFKKDGAELHAVLSGNDIYIHNGQSATSIITPEMRRYIFNLFDANFYYRSFVITNPTFSEVWFCFPEAGFEQPSMALVWNWDTGAKTFRDLLKASSTDSRSSSSTYGTTCIALGFIDDVGSEPWDSDTQAWDADSTLWNAHVSSPMASRLLMADRSAGQRAFLLDNSNTFDTTSFTWQVERINLSIIGRDRQGNPVNDTEIEKLLLEIWPKFDSPNGTQLTVYVGCSEHTESDPTWYGPYTYTVGSDSYIPVYHSARNLSLRFSATNGVGCRLLGYALEVADEGAYA